MDKIRVRATDPVWGIQMRETNILIHDPSSCTGRYCTFHNPSEHHMKDWEMTLRMDKGALVERACPHGIGHPDPDSLAFFKNTGQDFLGAHGCDGCCASDMVGTDE